MADSRGVEDFDRGREGGSNEIGDEGVKHLSEAMASPG